MASRKKELDMAETAATEEEGNLGFFARFKKSGEKLLKVACSCSINEAV